MTIDPMSAITGAAKVAGYFIDRNDRKKAAQANENLQREFAQNSIRWRVEDAQRAGIHPLYALGAPTIAGVGQSVGGGAVEALSSASQDISRAVNATRTAPERETAFQKTVQELTLTKAGLENELLASKIAQLKASINPPMPSIPIPEGKSDERPPLWLGGARWNTDAGSSNVEDYVKRYGEGAEYVMGPALLWQDYSRNNPGGAQFLTSLAKYIRHLNPSVELGRRIGNLPHRFSVRR